MNAYVVMILDRETGKPEIRTAYSYYEPPEPAAMIEVIAAETPGQARVEFAKQESEAFIEEDFTRIRVRKFATGIDHKRGRITANPLYDQGWWRAHEILDHAGATCDCPELENEELS